MAKTSFLFIGLIIITSPLFSQSPTQTPELAPRDRLYEPTPQLENIAFSIDSLVQLYSNKEEPIQGAVVSLVSSDSILLSKGYGLADVSSNRAFDPIETNVMVASVSKLMTSTAIFQLIEKGEIELEQPVSELIGDLEIDNPFDQPVLIKHILTHTAGFDDATIGSEAQSLDELSTLKEHLTKRLPPVVWEPGKYFNYSNLGMALLAHVVEQVSGMSFDDYLKENLYTPLGMTHSGFSYTNASSGNMMTRYKWKEDANDNLYLDDTYGIKYTHQIGAAGFQTTAYDMNQFMQMYLNKGNFNNSQILKGATIENAFRPHFYSHPLMTRKQGLTWRVRQSKGVTYNYHGGDDTAIESILVVFPDSDLAYFFASNNNEASDLKFEIRDLLIDRISNEPPQEFPQNFYSDTDLEQLTGTYQYMNDGQASVERLFSYLFGDVSEVTLANNQLSINGSLYKEVDSLLFEREEAGGRLVNFINDAYGNHYSTGYSTFRKISFFEKPSLHLPLLMGCFVVFLFSLITWTINYFKDKKIYTPRLYMGLAAFSLIMFFVLLATTTVGGSAKYGVPPIFYLCFTFPIIGILFFVLGLLKTPKIFAEKTVSRIGKIHFGLMAVSIAVCLLIYNYYNVIGYHF